MNIIIRYRIEIFNNVLTFIFNGSRIKLWKLSQIKNKVINYATTNISTILIVA